jgi:hypothetical protein
MATFASPDRAVAAALRMRAAMDQLSQQHGRTRTRICCSRSASTRARASRSCSTTGRIISADGQHRGAGAKPRRRARDLRDQPVVEHAETAKLLAGAGVTPVAQRHALRGIAGEVTLYEIA